MSTEAVKKTIMGRDRVRQGCGWEGVRDRNVEAGVPT